KPPRRRPCTCGRNGISRKGIASVECDRGVVRRLSRLGRRWKHWKGQPSTQGRRLEMVTRNVNCKGRTFRGKHRSPRGPQRDRVLALPRLLERQDTIPRNLGGEAVESLHQKMPQELWRSGNIRQDYGSALRTG